MWQFHMELSIQGNSWNVQGCKAPGVISHRPPCVVLASQRLRIATCDLSLAGSTPCVFSMCMDVSPSPNNFSIYLLAVWLSTAGLCMCPYLAVNRGNILFSSLTIFVHYPLCLCVCLYVHVLSESPHDPPQTMLCLLPSPPFPLTCNIYVHHPPSPAKNNHSKKSGTSITIIKLNHFQTEKPSKKRHKHTD